MTDGIEKVLLHGKNVAAMSDKIINELKAEVESLKAKLAAQDWHDASELPEEEGEYITIKIKGNNDKIVNYFRNSAELKEYYKTIGQETSGFMLESNMPKNNFWQNISRFKITLPEGK